MESPGFFRGVGMPQPRKGYHAPPQWSGAAPPTHDGSEVSFLKGFEVLENESIFQKYQHFSCPKNTFFKKNFEQLDIFNKIF